MPHFPLGLDAPVISTRCYCVHGVTFVRPAASSAPVLRHAASMTSSRQSLVSDVTRESPGTPVDDVIASEDDDDSLLEKDIVKRRIDLFENQVSRSV